MQVDLDYYLRPIDRAENEKERTAAECRGFLKEAAHKFLRNRLAVCGLILLVTIVTLAVFVPILSSYSYDQQDVLSANQPPSTAHWFGTDKFGRDLFVRVWSGARISLAVGFSCALCTLVIGVVYGAIAGYAGGNADLIMMRGVDIVYSVPSLIYVILIMLILGSNVKSVIIGISLSCWVGMARIVRNEVMRLKETEYAQAAALLGASNVRMLFSTLILNALGPIIVNVSMTVPQAIFTEAFLSFVGVGISPPAASWGTLAQDARTQMELYPYQIIYPLLAISITILAINFIADGLEKALNPNSDRQISE